MLRNSNAAGGGIGIGGSDDITAGAGFAELREQFGETVPDLAALDSMMSAAIGSAFTTAAVPEPTAVSLAILGGLMLAGRRRKRLR